MRNGIDMTTDRPEADLRSRVQRAMISNALLDWRGGVVIALAILLSFFFPEPVAGFQAWYWLIGGALAWILLTVSILMDPNTGARVAADLLRQKYEPTTLHNTESRDKLIKAFEYRGRIADTIRRTKRGVLRDHLAQTAAEMDEWIANLFNVAQRLDTFESDRTIQQDLKAVPVSIQNYEARLKSTTDPDLRKQIDETLASRRSQWTALQNLQNTIERAKLQMDSTLSAMGTVYSQLLLLNVKDVDSGRAQRLRDDIAEQVKGLHEVVEAMDEVYQYKQ
jgi:hypothetical protein